MHKSVAALSCHIYYLLCRSYIFMKKLNITRAFGEHSACCCLEKMFHNLTEKTEVHGKLTLLRRPGL